MTQTYGKTQQMTDWKDDLCEKINKEWDDGRQFVTGLNEMYEDIYLMMRGKRPTKNYDWQSDLTLRKAFQVVWTTISYVTQKVWGQEPVIGVKGYDAKGCWQRERLLQTWMSEDRYFMTMVLGLLRLMLNGTAIIKKVWNQELVKVDQGEAETPTWQNGRMATQTAPQVVSFPLKDEPDDIVVNNKDVVVDWLLRPGQPIHEGRFVIHREVVDIDELDPEVYVNLGEIEPEDLARTEEASDHARLRQEDKQENPPDSEFYDEAELYERVGWLPVKEKEDGPFQYVYDEEGDKMLMIATMAGKKSPVLVRFEPTPYEEINYVSAQLYIDPERWEAQGLVEPAKDIFVAIDDNVNAMFDEIWKNLMPPTMMNKHAVQEWDSIKWAPSQIWMMQGNPSENVMIPRGTEITRDAWQKHGMLDAESQLITSVTPAVQGTDASRTATQGALNVQFSTNKLDFITRMIEVTWLIPTSRMTTRFAQKFAHPLTFLAILGEPFRFDRFMEEYKYQPAASSVQTPEQTEIEIQQDMQMIQVLSAIPNPNTPKMINYFLANILRNRKRPQLAAMLDEEYFEPQGEAGNMQMIQRSLGAGTSSNEEGLSMSPTERGIRQRTYQPRGI